jgi:hypothetical protein
MTVEVFRRQRRMDAIPHLACGSRVYVRQIWGEPLQTWGQFPDPAERPFAIRSLRRSSIHRGDTMSHDRIRAVASRMAALAVLVGAALLTGPGLAGAALAQVQPPDLPAGRAGVAPPAPPITTSSGGTSLWAFVLVAVAAALLTLALVGSWQAYRRARRRTALAAA